MSDLYKTASIQLVGLANDNPYTQVYLGTFHLEKKGDLFVPRVRNVGLDGKEECPVEFHFNADGGANVRVPRWCGGDGLAISQSPKSGLRFITGIHSGWASGSSGKLVNGGKEMLDILRSLSPA